MVLPGGKVQQRGGEDQRRPAGSTPPCGQCAKIPRGEAAHWSNAVDPTPESRRAVAHYLECKAVNWNCDDARDPLVRQHAAIMRAVEEGTEKVKEALFVELLKVRGGRTPS